MTSYTSSISLSWMPPTGQVAMYRLEWDNGREPMNRTINDTSALLSDLISGTNYTITIRAIAADNTTQGDPVTVSTFTSKSIFTYVFYVLTVMLVKVLIIENFSLWCLIKSILVIKTFLPICSLILHDDDGVTSALWVKQFHLRKTLQEDQYLFFINGDEDKWWSRTTFVLARFIISALHLYVNPPFTCPQSPTLSLTCKSIL